MTLQTKLTDVVSRQHSRVHRAVWLVAGRARLHANRRVFERKRAALVAMAYDYRFSIGFIGSSFACGAKLIRRRFCEQIENLASSGE